MKHPSLNNGVIIFALLVSMLTPCCVLAQQRKANELFPIRKHGKWGYADRRGEMVIRAQFDSAFSFEDGIAEVSQKDQPHRAFIDTSGRVVLSSDFGWASSSFSGGMLQVKIGDLYGYCDKTGTIVIAPQFIDAGDFAEGLARVKVGGKWGYINTTGAIVIPPQFADAGEFSDGLADVTFDEEPPMGDFGQFLIERDKLETRLWGYIDKQGKVVIPPRFNFTGEFSEGLAPIGFGKKAADLNADQTGRKWGFIDTSGKTVIKLEFGDARTFSEGLAPVRVGRKWGYVDRTGRLVIKPRFEDAWSFHGGLALASVGYTKTFFPHKGVSVIAIKIVGKHGYIDHSGRFVSSKLTWTQK